MEGLLIPILFTSAMLIGNLMLNNIYSIEYTEKPPLTNILSAEPIKQTFKREELCRSVLEDYFKQPFPKNSKFIKNPETNRYLELDGYNKQLKLAFEHNGIQHYRYPNQYNETIEQFRNRVRRDRYKAKKCEELGITLIIIPYTEKDVKSYILREIRNYSPNY